jgi:hypothetical protein
MKPLTRLRSKGRFEAIRITRKYLIIVKVTDNYKHASLLRYGINYYFEKFYA